MKIRQANKVLRKAGDWFDAVFTVTKPLPPIPRGITLRRASRRYLRYQYRLGDPLVAKLRKQ